MKKFLFACLLSMIVLPEMVFAAQPFPQSCYATTRCGARTSLTTFAALGGGLVGTHLGLALGVPGYIMGGVGGYIIGQNLGGKIAKNYSANEYLYFEDGTCLECDTYQMGENYECSNGIIVSNGSDVFRCRTQLFVDSWEQIDLLPCTDSDIQNKSAKNTKVEIHATTDKPVYDGVNAYSGDACLMISCVDDGYTYDSASQECVENAAPKKDNPTGGGKTSASCTDRCRGMSGVQYTECVTCCKVSEDYADWNGSECVCADKTLDFNVLTQKCEAPSETTITLPEDVVTPECPDTQVTILNQWLIQYAGNSDVISRVQVLLDYCNGAVINITSFNQMFTELQNFIDGLATSAEQDASRRRIEEAVSAINSRIGNLDVSVWRNAEGEFNTSRLLSDSIAGVVLGTAGGLITSHVVKKNNIASGFEDIKCAIGGQVVADWGDQFQVGIQ